MNFVTRAVRGATQAGMTLSGVILSLVIVLLVANVLLRFFGIQILGLYELLTPMTVVLLGLSLGDSQREKQHVSIDLLTAKFNPRVQRVLSVLTTAFSITVFAVIVIALVRYASFQVKAGSASEILKIPTWPTLLALICGMVLLLLTLLVDLYRQGTAVFTGVDKKEIW